MEAGAGIEPAIRYTPFRHGFHNVIISFRTLLDTIGLD